MDISISSAAMGAALSFITTHTKSAHSTLRCSKGKVYVVAQGSGALVRIKLLDSSESTGSAGGFTFNNSVMTSILSGRKEVTFKVSGDDESEVNFSAQGRGRKYSGSIVILPLEDIHIPKIEDTASSQLTLTADMHASLNSAVRTIGLTDIYTGKTMFMSCMINKDGLRAACFDRYHMGIYEDESVVSKKAVEFTLPLTTFSTLSAIAGDNQYTLTITESALVAQGADFFVLLPLMQPDGELQLSTALTIYQECQSAQADLAFTIQSSDVLTTLGNMSGIYENNSTLELAAKGDVVKFMLKTSYGQVNESFKIKDVSGATQTSRFKFDPNLLNDVMGVMPSDTPVATQLMVDRYATFSAPVSSGKSRAFYFCSLM